MMSDTLDSVLDDDEAEEESEELTNQADIFTLVLVYITLSNLDNTYFLIFLC
jgi:hypothetical protein